MSQGPDITTLLRKNIRKLKPYSSARSEFAGQAELYLDANENYRSFLDPPVNRYPDPLQRKLVSRISEVKGIEKECIFVGNGSDEAIDLVFRAFAEPEDDNALITPPTYGVYQVFADLNNVETIKVPLQDDFSLDVEGLSILFDHRDFAQNLKLLFICSPNNPTGNSMNKEDIISLVRSFPGIVIVDEAYQDFSEAPSCIDQVKHFTNLIVLQTFSKAWGMAGARVGMAFASPKIIQVFQAIKYPYNVSELSQQAALQALDRYEEVLKEIKVIQDNRKRLEDTLNRIAYVEQVFPSDANFLLVRVSNPGELYEALKQRGIIIRNRDSEYKCKGCVRITVGSTEEIDRLIQAMQEISLDGKGTDQ